MSMGGLDLARQQALDLFSQMKLWGVQGKFAGTAKSPPDFFAVVFLIFTTWQGSTSFSLCLPIAGCIYYGAVLQ